MKKQKKKPKVKEQLGILKDKFSRRKQLVLKNIHNS
jgi:hypothetical protein